VVGGFYGMKLRDDALLCEIGIVAYVYLLLENHHDPVNGVYWWKNDLVI
jgi:hypothetical protein